MSFISKIQKGTDTYDIRDKRIPSDALTEAEIGDILSVQQDGTSKKIVPISPQPDGMVLDVDNDRIVQNNVDVTSATKTVLDLQLKADLVDGKVPSSQLPAYVDDVVEGYYYEGSFYEDAAHTILITPATGKIYVDLSSNLTYRWSGTVYVEISKSLALGTTHATAGYGDESRTAYTHTSLTNNPHQVTAQQLGAVKSVNGETPDQYGAVTIEKVNFADNLYSVDNQEDTGTYVFRTAGGNASIETGTGTLGSVLGNTVVTGLDTETHQATSITIAKPTAFKSVMLNQFNKLDTTMVFANTTIEDGAFVYSATSSAAIVHVVGGVVAGNGLVGYTCAWLTAENTPIATIDTACSKFGFLLTKPTASSSGITELSFVTDDDELKTTQGWTWVTSGEYGKRVNVNFGETNGYLIIITTNTDNLQVHPRWSGYMDGSLAEYSQSTVAIPTTDTSGNNLPTYTYGLPKLTLFTGNTIYDKIDYNGSKYVQEVGYMLYSLENLATVRALTDEYIYDTNCILYQLTTPVTYSLSSSVTGEYQVHDFGTEEFLYSDTNNIPLTATTWYGQDLKNKLRTDVVTISSQSLSTSQKSQVQSNIGAVGTALIGQPNGVAQLDSDGKVPSTQLQNYAKSVNSEVPDATGNINLQSVPLAENLLSPDNTSDSGQYVFRTSGGSASLSDGEAQLLTTSGVSVNPTHRDESFVITTFDTNSSAVANVVTIDTTTWRNNDTVGLTSGTYHFVYNGTAWAVSCVEAGLVQREIVLSACGITLSRTEYINDKIDVVYTRANSATGASVSGREFNPTINATTWEAQGIDVSTYPADFIANSPTYTVPANTNYYSQPTLTQEYLVGQTSDTTSANYVNTTYGTITISGTTYYVSYMDMVETVTWNVIQNEQTIRTNVSISTFGISISSGFRMLANDKITVSKVDNVLTVTATPVCAVTFDPETQFTKSTWFSASSPVHNTVGLVTFTWSTTTSKWTCSANSAEYDRTAMSSTFGITYSITSGVPQVDGDKINIQANIVVSAVPTYTQWLEVNSFGASFGDETEEETQKALWRALISNAGTYRFVYDDYVPSGTTYYSDVTLETSAGTTSEALPTKAYNPLYGTISVSGTDYYVKTSDVTLQAYTLYNQSTLATVAKSVDIDDYGLILTGTVGRQDYIQVVYTKLIPGAISNCTPTAFQSIGTNQFNWRKSVNGYKIVDNEIVAGTSSDYVAWCHLCYSDERGYTLYSENGFGTFECGWSNEEPDSTAITSTELVDFTEEGFLIRTDLGGTSWDVAGSYVPTAPAEVHNLYIPTDHEDGYVVIYMTVNPAVSNTSGNLCIHPRWSGYRNLTHGFVTDAQVASYNQTYGDDITMGTDYDGHTTTLTLPRYGTNDTTQAIEALPYTTGGMPSVNAVADKIQLDRNKYVKNIGSLPYTAQNLEYVKSLGVDYTYDTATIYYVLTTPTTYTLFKYVPSGITYYSDTALTTVAGTTVANYTQPDYVYTNYAEIVVSGTTYYVKTSDVIANTNSYIVGDFGTEQYLGTTVVVGSESLYGQNLRDKLRTDVLQISAQELTSGQKEQVHENLDIYADKIDFSSSDSTKVSSILTSKANESIVSGAYSLTTAYAVGDIAIYNNTLYRCIVANTGVLPTNGSYWASTTIDYLLDQKANWAYTGTGSLSTTAQTLQGGVNELYSSKLNASAISNYYTKTESDTLLANKMGCYFSSASQTKSSKDQTTTMTAGWHPLLSITNSGTHYLQRFRMNTAGNWESFLLIDVFCAYAVGGNVSPTITITGVQRSGPVNKFRCVVDTYNSGNITLQYYTGSTWTFPTWASMITLYELGNEMGKKTGTITYASDFFSTDSTSYSYTSETNWGVGYSFASTKIYTS